MLELCFATLIEMMGSDSWRTREWASWATTRLVYLTEQADQVKQATSHRDLEIAHRCRKIMTGYRGMYTPPYPYLAVIDFAPRESGWITGDDHYDEAEQCAPDNNTSAYVRLLLTKGVPRNTVRLMVLKACGKRLSLRTTEWLNEMTVWAWTKVGPRDQ